MDEEGIAWRVSHGDNAPLREFLLPSCLCEDQILVDFRVSANDAARDVCIARVVVVNAGEHLDAGPGWWLLGGLGTGGWDVGLLVEKSLFQIPK